MTTGRLLVTAAGVGMPALGPGEPPGPTGSAPAGTPGDMIAPEGMPPEMTPPWHALQLSPAMPAMPAMGDPTICSPPPQGAGWHGAC